MRIKIILLRTSKSENIDYVKPVAEEDTDKPDASETVPVTQPEYDFNQAAQRWRLSDGPPFPIAVSRIDPRTQAAATRPRERSRAESHARQVRAAPAARTIRTASTPRPRKIGRRRAHKCPAQPPGPSKARTGVHAPAGGPGPGEGIRHRSWGGAATAIG